MKPRIFAVIENGKIDLSTNFLGKFPKDELIVENADYSIAIRGMILNSSELFAGQDVVNTNRTFQLLKMKLYVCPICGNIIQSTGEAVVSCCGITLPALEAEVADGAHQCKIESVEDEYCVSVSHEMSKTHYISFIAAVRDDGCEIKKLYPEGSADARFKMNRVKYFYYYCNRHGLYKIEW